jgi:putative ABC transport system substrate-binding protein
VPVVIGRRELLSALGAAAAWSFDASAQQPQRVPKVGYLWHAANAEEEGAYYKALYEGFDRLGYHDGRNIILEHRFPNETPERFKAMADELVALNVDVLMGANAATFYLTKATSKIPIVFMFIADPVGLHYVDSLAHPGRNATGFATFGRDLASKRLDFLKEVAPGLSRVALLVNPDDPSAAMYTQTNQAAAVEAGMTVEPFEVRSSQGLEAAFDAMTRANMQMVNLTPCGGISYQSRAIIPKLAIDRRLPLCAYSRETFEHGALVSYGVDQVEMCRHSAVYVDRILKGEKPADLPVEMPTKIELLINLRTAKTLGLKIPATLLVAATDVIE